MSPARKRVLRTVSGPKPSGKGSKQGTKTSLVGRWLGCPLALGLLPGHGGSAFRSFTEQLPILSVSLKGRLHQGRKPTQAAGLLWQQA